MANKINKAFSAIFLNENGKLSMTVIFAMLAFAIVITIYIRGLLFGQELSNSWLSWSIEIAAVAIGVRAGQRGFQFIGEGMASIGKRKRQGEVLIKEDLPKPPPSEPVTHQQVGFFNTADFNSHDGAPMPPQVFGNILVLIDNLNVLRAELGVPITISSGYRSKKQNKISGGKQHSQHLLGTAADIKAKGRSPREVLATIERLKDEGKMMRGGYKAYSNFVHYDIRGTDITW